MVPNPPQQLGPITPFRLGKGTSLHRILDVRFAENGFTPCKGRPTRFAPMYDESGKCVPSLYAGESFDCVAFETVFHEVPATGKIRIVRLGEIQGRARTVLKTNRRFRLAALFAPELKSFGLERSQLIDTTAKWYPKTARFAAAIHRQYKDIDGLVWTSRQCDPERAFLLFGDRVLSDDLDIVSTAVELAQSSELLKALRRVGARAAITLVR